jgi:Ca2+-transporting ATPase
MGAGGTEVTREAADLVLTDDDFASIVAGIREGRGVTDNIQKTLLYLLAGNVGELLAVLGAMLLSLPIPLLPLQILWLNLVSDGPPALALVVDPPDPDGMARPPRAPGAPILGRAEWLWIGVVGLLEGALVLGLYAWALAARGEAVARDLTFCALVFAQLLLPLAVRSRRRTLWGVGALGNKRLLVVIVGSVLLQAGIHHVGVLREALGLVVLPLADFGLALLVGLVPVSLVEGAKLVRRLLGTR